MTEPRIVHTTQTSTRPDGRQFVACTCPLGVDHVPADIISPAEDHPGMWWIRFQGEVAE